VKTEKKVGIAGYGVYIPRYRIKISDIAKVWGKDGGEIVNSLKIYEKTVPSHDEDSATMAYEAIKYALKRAMVDTKEIGALYFGTESKPFDVKPTSTIVADALSLPETMLSCDIEFACKAGTEAIEMATGVVASGMVNYSIAVGSDTAQAMPGDILEYSASSGAAAVIISSERYVAEIEGTFSYVTDTPDFFRRGKFPDHLERFTGEEAYFKHIINATKGLLNELSIEIEDVDYFVFHQPNGKFPLKVASILGIEKKKVEKGILVDRIGNTYSASTLIALSKILDIAKDGERIFAVSYGSGAGSDAISIVVNESIEKIKRVAPTVEKMVKDCIYVDYPRYILNNRILEVKSWSQ